MDYNRKKIETVKDVFDLIVGVVYFVNENGEETKAWLSTDTQVLNIRNIENDEYEIMVKED